MIKYVFSKKNMILLGVVVLLIGLYVLFTVFVSENSSTSSNSYLYVGDYLIWNYDHGKFKQLTKAPEGVQEYDFVVYDGMNRKEAQMAQYSNNSWYFFTKDYGDINVKNFRLAYTGMDDIAILNYKLERYELSDSQYISQVNNTKNEEELLAFQNSLIKVKVDLDSDQEDEILYTMSSYSLDMPTTYQEMKSYLFLVDDNKVSIINQSKDMQPFDIIEILDLNDDGHYEIIASKGRLDIPALDDCYQLYEYKDGRYQLKQDCIME